MAYRAYWYEDCEWFTVFEIRNSFPICEKCKKELLNI